jgi:hypothetical protein
MLQLLLYFFRVLELKFCTLISDIGMSQIIQKCLDIQSLNCCGCRAITDNTVYLLSHYSRKLQKLNIGYNSNISPESVFRFLSHKNDGFKILLCVSCIKISDEYTIYLKDRFPDTDINSAILI